MSRIVKVKLFNRVARFVDKYPRQRFSLHLRYFAPHARFAQAYKDAYWDGYIKFLKDDRVSSGMFLAYRRELEKEYDVEFDVNDRRRRVSFRTTDFHTGVDHGERKYQLECLDKMFRAKSGGLVLSATGTGKTFIVGMYFFALIGHGVFVVDELTLLDQARKELQKVVGEKIGIVGESKFKPRRITVATIQTLHLHTGDPKFDEWKRQIRVLVIDELHLHLNKRTKSVIKDISPRVVFGLTATLEMQKKPIRMEAHAMTGKVLYDYPIQRGVKEKYLAPGVVVSVEVKQSQKAETEYHESYVTLVRDSLKRNMLITDIVKTCHDKGRSIVVLVERIRHVKALSEMLDDIPHRMVFGEKKVVQRIKAKDKFQAGKIRLLICNKVFKKGIDIKNIDTIVEGSAMKSKNDAIQKFGRGVRIFKGKIGLVYFDISDRMNGPHYLAINRFHSATSSRLNAFKARKIPILKVDSSLGPRRIVRRGIKFLRKYVKKLNG